MGESRMEATASIDRDESRTLLDALQVGGGGRDCPPYDRRGSSVSEDREAKIACITGDKPDDYCITIGPGDGTFVRWKISYETAKKLRRELNQRLD
jgi:hypothetical protein